MSKNKTRIKNIKFRFPLKGYGVVNYDSNSQKFFLSLDEGLKKQLWDSNENSMYAKKNFYKKVDDDGNEYIDYRLKISSECITRGLFSKEVIAENPNIAHSDPVLYAFLASPVGVLRGYSFMNQSEAVKRKSPVHLFDAEQTDNSLSHLEMHSRSGPKAENKERDEDESKDSTIYKKEEVGWTEYMGYGEIDLMALQFISCDHILDRYCFNRDKFESYYKKFMNMHMDFPNELGYYQPKEAYYDLPEYGVKLNEDQVKHFVGFYLNKLRELHIGRKSAFVDVKNVEVKFVTDSVDEGFEDKGWYEVVDLDNGSIGFSNGDNTITFDDLELEDFFTEVDHETADEKRKDFENKVDNAKEKEKAKNKEKKANKGKRKNKSQEKGFVEGKLLSDADKGGKLVANSGDTVKVHERDFNEAEATDKVRIKNEDNTETKVDKQYLEVKS